MASEGRTWPRDRQIVRVLRDLLAELHTAKGGRGCEGRCHSTFGAGCPMSDAVAIIKAIEETTTPPATQPPATPGGTP